MPIKRKYKYIDSIEKLKIESFKGDDYTFELHPEVLLSSELATDEWCDKVLEQTHTEIMQKSLYGDNSENQKQYEFTMFYVVAKGLKLYFLIDLKTNLVHERQFFVDSINWNHGMSYKPVRKTKVYAIHYDCENFSWASKKLHDKKNGPSIIKNMQWDYQIVFNRMPQNTLPIYDMTINEYGYLVDMTFTCNNTFMKLSSLKAQYSEISQMHIKFGSLDKISVGNKKLKELFTLIEMICI